MNMDLRSLKHVVVLSQQLSYTKAAQDLCITQSALSRSIQAIEHEAKVKLFDRDRSGVHLTAVGKDFVKRAMQLLRDADDLTHILRRSANAEMGEVSFGLGPLAAQALLPSVLPDTFTTKPELRTHVMVRHVEALLASLLNEELEFVITAESELMQSGALKGEFIGWLPMSLIVRAHHPLLKNSPRAQKLDYPLLSPGHFRNIDKWPVHFRSYLAGPLHIIEDYGVASRITELTDAIWLSSTLAAAFEIRAGRLKEIPIPKRQKAFRFKMMIYSFNRRSLSPAALILKESFKKQLSAMG
ncbi:MAG: LysR family transcriptional regulator [Spongiibacteraceae bacterium]